MGRTKIFKTEKFISYNPETDMSTCLQCQQIFRGKVTGNIKRHFRKIHGASFIDGDSSEEPSGSKSNLLTNAICKEKTKNVCIDMDKSEFLKCCVGLVTIKNIPFKIFDDEQFFKKILKPYEMVFETNLNSTDIVNKINETSFTIKQMIANTVYKKLVCLKLDVASQMSKQILVINIQFIINFKIYVCTLGMLQLKKSHTADFLKNEVVSCLKEFQIEINQVYSIITDNGTNVSNASKLLREMQEEIQINIKSENDAFSESDSSINEYHFKEIHQKLTLVLSVVRCAAHAIEQAAFDVFVTIQNEIEVCRKAVKALQNIHLPTIDNNTHWNSTFAMIKSLSNLRSFLENNGEPLNFTELDWYFVKNFLKAFEPLAEFTKKIHNEDYLIGDFYRDWLCCELELEEFIKESVLAKNLLDAMELQKIYLFQNDAFVTAIFMDPRFNFLNSTFLTDEQRKRAVQQLLKTSELIKQLQGGEENRYNVASVNTCTSFVDSSLSENNFSKLELKIASMVGTNFTSTEQLSLKHILEHLSYNERVSLSTNVLEHWKTLSSKEVLLGKLAQVVLAVPSTQVSVERAFSALSTILTENQNEIPIKTLNNILLVKLNADFLKDHNLE